MAEVPSTIGGEMAAAPFVHGGSRYDLRCYRGRLYHFLDIIDPRMLLVTD
eukprot:SAG11_NODE_21002_length_434_cov_0.785075_1_plen_49_part_10